MSAKSTKSRKLSVLPGGRSAKPAPPAPARVPRIAEVYDALQQMMLGLGADALEEQGPLSDEEDEYAQDIDRLAGVVAEVMGRARDSVNFVAGSALADWTEVFQMPASQQPEDPYARPLWLLARAWHTIQSIRAGAVKNPKGHLRAWRAWRSVIQSEPLDVRIEAARKLQKERKDFVRRQGPAPVAACSSPGMRL
jgi:hypothetical protein